MRRKLIGFKTWCEEMNPSMEKTVGAQGNPDEKDKPDYFDGLENEFGLEWDQVASMMEDEPWISTNFAMNGINYKRSAWQIVKGSLNKNGADIVLKPQANDRSFLKHGQYLNKSEPTTQRMHLNREQLIAFLTKGWTPAIQAKQAGGMGGMADPSGGMGGPPL